MTWNHLFRFNHLNIIFSNIIRFSTVSYITTWSPITTAVINYWRVRAHLGVSILDLKVKKITDLQQTKDRATKLLACKRFHLCSPLSNPSRLAEAVNERREHAGAGEEGERQAAPWDEWGHPSSSGSAATKDCIFEGWCHRTQAAWEQSRLCWAERGRQAPRTFTTDDL